MPPFTKRDIDDMSFPPHPLAPGGGGVPGNSGRRVGKLYLAGVAARAAAAQRKEDRTNVLLASTNKTQPSTPSNCEIQYQHCSNEKSHSDATSTTNTAMEGEKIIFETLTPVTELLHKSLPLVIASPALQQTSIVELPAMQPFPCVQLNTQPPTVKESTKQHLNTPAGDEEYAPYINKEVDARLISNDPLLSNNLIEDEMAPSCAACQLCRDPNSDTDDYCFCMNNNGDAHTICTEQMDFQTPAWDKLVITHLDFATVGKSTDMVSSCVGYKVPTILPPGTKPTLS